MQDIFNSIAAVVREATVDDEQARKAVMFAAWRKAAGRLLAERAVPLDFAERRLTVAVSGLDWKRQMQDLGPQMVFKLNAAFGRPVLSFIDFVVDEEAVIRAAGRGKVGVSAKMQNDPPPEVEHAAEAIADPQLRKIFLSAAAACTDRLKGPK